MRTRILHVTFALLALGLTVAARGDGDAKKKLSDRAAVAIARFDQFTATELELISRGEVTFTTEAFDDAVQTLVAISQSTDFTKPEKVKFIVDLSAACGKFFLRLTEPFTDPVPPPPTAAELRAQGYENWFGRNLKYGWDRFAWYAQMIGKDIMRTVPFTWDKEGFRWHLPYVFPIWGSDGQRSRAAKKMAVTLATAIDEQMKAILAGTRSPEALAGMALIVEEMRKSEPMVYGARNQRVRYAFLGLAVFFFLHPPINPFPFFWTEKTKWSPMVSAILQSGLMLYGARVRKLDSGLQAYWTLSRTLKRIQKDPAQLAQWRSCGGTLADEGTDPLEPKDGEEKMAEPPHPDAHETDDGMRRGVPRAG